MLKLLCKSPDEGRYYFMGDGDGVSMLQHPCSPSQSIEYVDKLSDFLRKSIDTGFIEDMREFDNMELLTQYAFHDRNVYSSQTHYAQTTKEEKKYRLVFAPMETVLEYYSDVERMIRLRDFAGVDLFLDQLWECDVVQNNDNLLIKLEELKTAFDSARFPYADKERIAKVFTGGKLKPNILGLAG